MEMLILAFFIKGLNLLEVKLIFQTLVYMQQSLLQFIQFSYISMDCHQFILLSNYLQQILLLILYLFQHQNFYLYHVLYLTSIGLYNSFHLAISLFHILPIYHLKILLHMLSHLAMLFYPDLIYCFLQNLLHIFFLIQKMYICLFHEIIRQQSLHHKHFHRTQIFLFLFFIHSRNLLYI